MKTHNIFLEIDSTLFSDAARGIVWTIFFQRLFGLIEPDTREFLHVSYPHIPIKELELLVEENISQITRSFEQSKNSELSTESSFESLRYYQDLLTANKGSSKPYKTYKIGIKFFEDAVPQRQASGQNRAPKVKSNAARNTSLDKSDDNPITRDKSNLNCWEQWIVTFRVQSKAPSAHTKDDRNHEKFQAQYQMSQVHISEKFKQVILKILECAASNSKNVPPVYTKTFYSPFPFDIELILGNAEPFAEPEPETERRNSLDYRGFFKRLFAE